METSEKYEELDKKLVQIVPSERQFRHQQMEFYGFVHFTVNTFTGKEWGDGTEPESIFDPACLDAEQWVRAAKDGGMTGLILTCKHHDGFCLWPSKMTSHTVANSPYKDGKGDVVRELSQACAKEGLKFGVYLSPWDRNCELYGQGKAYDDYFAAQLTELLTWYGPVFCVWFDGACGEGPNGKKQIYDWERYYKTIRELQPQACISVSGPDIRWCGNEAGDTRPSEWSVVPRSLFDQRKITENSQQTDDAAFREKRLADGDRDLGSRKVMQDTDQAIWYPAEVNTSIRPGWFYHEDEDDQVKSLEELKSVYLRSVGGNATFLLNLPPDKRGVFHEKDVMRLHELGEWIRGTFDRKKSSILQADIAANSEKKGYEAVHVREDSYECCFCPDEKEKTMTELSFTWKREQKIRYIVIKEDIRKSQRIERFKIFKGCGEEREEIAEGTTVGYQKIVSLPEEISVKELTLQVTDSRQEVILSYVGAFSDGER